MRRHLHAATSLTLSLTLLAACHDGPAGYDPPPPDTRTIGWRADLQALAAEVTRAYPGPGKDAVVAHFRSDVAALDGAVPRLTDEDLVIGIQRALAAVGNGHTSIIPIPTPTVAFAALPVDFYWFDDGVYIVGGAAESRGLVGARVTEVGGVPVDTIVARIGAFVSSDNAMSARWLGAQVMSYPAVLRASGAAAPDAGITLRVVDAAGASRAVTLAAGARQPAQRLAPVGAEGPSTPRYLRHLDRPFWLEALPQAGALYVGFSAVRDDAGETLAAFADRVAAAARAGGYRTLIVDVRLNNGGDNRLLPPVVRALTAFAATPDARLFVLAGRGTYSAAQNFVNQIERPTRAIFVGEPTGSRPNFAGDDSDLQLAYSRLHVSVASRWYQDSDAGDARPWIAPRLAVPVRAQDYFANRDPAMDAVLQSLATLSSVRHP
jgi:hypothetical protein